MFPNLLSNVPSMLVNVPTHIRAVFTTCTIPNVIVATMSQLKFDPEKYGAVHYKKYKGRNAQMTCHEEGKRKKTSAAQIKMEK